MVIEIRIQLIWIIYTFKFSIVNFEFTLTHNSNEISAFLEEIRLEW